MLSQVLSLPPSKNPPVHNNNNNPSQTTHSNPLDLSAAMSSQYSKRQSPGDRLRELQQMDPKTRAEEIARENAEIDKDIAVCIFGDGTTRLDCREHLCSAG